MGIIEGRLRDQALGEQHFCAVVRTAREFDVRPLRFNGVFLEISLGALERRTRRLQICFGAAKGRFELFTVELHQHVVGVDDAVDVHVERSEVFLEPVPA